MEILALLATLCLTSLKKIKLLIEAIYVAFYMFWRILRRGCMEMRIIWIHESLLRSLDLWVP
jgi:hypothetical protein